VLLRAAAALDLAKDKQTVNVPVWAGVGAKGAGGLLLLWRKQS